VPERLFRDRREAGRVLAGLLERYQGRSDVVVLALPRGGVPVGYEVAIALGAPLDVFLVRKLGVPGHEELAMGAIASNDVVVLNDDVVRDLGIPEDVIRRVAAAESRELERRERAYWDGRSMAPVEGRTVILVDDGLATGSSMRAAVRALRRLHPTGIVVAVPTAPASTCGELGAEVDEVVCASTPSPFLAVGRSYWDFTQTTDDEVRRLLGSAAAPAPDSGNSPGHSPVDALRADLLPSAGTAGDDDALLDLVGDAHFVLLGEASHGTHEFYARRAAITRRLIEEKGFCAVAAEADWPDAYRVNRYVRGRSDDETAEEALGGFDRFPGWMWRNTVVADFVRWLHAGNERARREGAPEAGFYGLDLYSLSRSMHKVISHLDRMDPVAAARARERYACFDHAGGEGQDDGSAAAFGAGDECEREAVEQLVDLHRHALEYARRDGLMAEDDYFYAEQNARTVKSAEAYYRTMFAGRVSSWNLRDRHMVDTLDALADHLSRRRGEPARIVVWAHNSHVGDARATELGAQGELTVGQLVRQRRPGYCVLVGFTTHAGTVTAAEEWGGPPQRMRVRSALGGSVEELLHQVGEEGFSLLFPRAAAAARALRPVLLERAIGVVYRPRTERQSHYFRSRLPDQFDAVIHVDETRALEPLERSSGWDDGEAPETYPFAV